MKQYPAPSRLAQPIVFQANGASQAWSAMPAALTEYRGGSTARWKYDLSYASQARFVVRVSTAGAVGAELRVQYSLDETTWNYLDGASGPAVTGINNTSPTKESVWVTIVAAARTDVWLRVIGIGGDGTLSPAFGTVALQVR